MARIPLLALAALTLIALLTNACWTSSGKRVSVDAFVRAPGAADLREGARPEPLVLEFDGSAAPLERVGKTLEGGVKLSPPARGEWRWENDRRLVFSPSQDWPIGKDFSVLLERGLLPPRVRAKSSKLAFKSAPFKVTAGPAQFYVDPVDPRVKKVVATFRFSHPVDAEDFEKRVALEYKQRSADGLLKSSGRYAATVTFDKRNGEAYVHSAPIAIPQEEAEMTITLKSGARARAGGPGFEEAIEQKVRVPGMYDYFRVESCQTQIARDERREPKQTLALTLSSPAHERDVADAVEAWVLPADWRGRAKDELVKNYYWTAQQVDPEVLSASTRAVLSPSPTEREQSAVHAFRLDVPPGRYLFVRLPKGLRGYGGYELAKTFETVVRAPEYEKELKILHDGAVLRLSGERKLSVYALGVEELRFEIGRVREGEIAHLVTQSQGDFSHPAFENWRFGEDDLVERYVEPRRLRALPPGKAQYTALDLSGWLRENGAPRRGLFFVRAQEWDPIHKRVTNLEDRRFILITDLGVVVKASRDGRRDVLVQNLASGGPLEGALVEVLGRNGAAVVSARTDASGRARFPSLKDFTREKTPAAYVVRRGDDLAFLPYERSDRRLDFSRFDVGGETSAGARDRLEAYLFSDRGLYRPGEEIHVGALVRSLDWTRPLAGLPVEAVVVDPRGLEVERRKIALSTAAFHELSYQTQENGPTGRYGFSLYVVKDGRRRSLLGSTSVRVEEFLPDRMKVAAAFERGRDEGWTGPDGLVALVTLKSLFGAPAADRRVSTRLTLTPAAPYLPRFSGFRFFDPALAKKSFSEDLADANTGADGSARVEVDLSRFAGATYRVALHVDGFETGGGRGVAAETSVIVSPRRYLVGLKPDGDLTYVRRGSKRSVGAIAAGPDGGPVAVDVVSLFIVELKHVSALVKQADGTLKYQSVKKEVVVSTRAISLPLQGANVVLDARRAGDFELVLKDAADGELNRICYSVAGEANLERSLEKTAELQVRLSKPDFSPGEPVELEIRAPYAGAGLITIERDHVYAHKWFSSATTASTQTIRVPTDLEGNAYVTVTLLRSPLSREIFMSPLSYSATPFSLRRKRRELPVTLESAALARPGEPLRLRFKTERPSKLVVFAVDEGILQVAGHKTPDPLAVFFRKRALEVDTFQLLDLVLPEHRLLQELSAVGGDMGADAAGKNLNPFKRKREKPAVFWSGLIDAGPQWREATFVTPDSFNGRLRVIAVAAAPDAIGVAERQTLVRAPLVLSPNAPLFAAPGDEFEVSVGVANLAEGTGPSARVVLELSSNGFLELLSGATRELAVPEGREGLAAFRARAKRSLGSADLRVIAHSGVFVSTRSFSLSIRPLSPYAVDLTGGYVRGGKADAPTPRRMYPAYRTLQAQASRLPLALAGGLLSYVDEYPFLCTEQLTSKAFAALAVRHRPEFSAPGKTEARYEEALRVLRSRQTAEGNFGYWAANSFGAPYIDAYAMQFLTEAKDWGYAVPEDMMTRGLANLRSVGNTPAGSVADVRVRAYALYVLARNGAVVTKELAALRARVDAGKDGAWRRDLSAGYMAATYKLLRLDDEANALMDDARLGAPTLEDCENFYGAMERDAQLLFLIARHFPERLARVSEKELASLAGEVNSGRYTTLSSARAVLAFAAFADAAGPASPAQARITQILESGEKQALPLPASLFAKVAFSPQAQRLRVEAHGPFGHFYSVVQKGYDLDVPAAPLLQRLEVQRELRDHAGAVVTSAALGEELSVHVKLRALEARVPGVAVVDLLPAGFEPVLDGEKTPSGWTPEWVDAREDRLLFFGAAGTAVQEYVYKVRAVARGRFAVPPAFAQAMYDRSAQARSAPGAFEIK